MLVISQNVQIDSLKLTTLLNKKATITIGNELKKGTTYKYLYTDCSKLLDSLIKEAKLHEQQVRFLKDSVIQPLKILSIEKTAEANFNKEKTQLEKKYFESKLKQEKKKKWTWFGVGGGVGLIVGVLLNR